jgi:hypothetical protein
MGIDGRILTAGIMFAIFATMVVFAFSYGADEAGMMPLVVGIPGLVLTLAQLIIEIRTKHTDVKVVSREERSNEFRMFGWFFVFIAGIILFGFPYAAPLIVAAYLHFSWQEKWYTVLGAAVFAWAVLHYLFGVVLGLPLFEGLVVNALLY